MATLCLFGLAHTHVCRPGIMVLKADNGVLLIPIHTHVLCMLIVACWLRFHSLCRGALFQPCFALFKMQCVFTLHFGTILIAMLPLCFKPLLTCLSSLTPRHWSLVQRYVWSTVCSHTLHCVWEHTMRVCQMGMLAWSYHSRKSSRLLFLFNCVPHNGKLKLCRTSWFHCVP